MKLLIISHTEHYTDTSGEIVGWGPTLTEINYLATIFDEVYHIATHLDQVPPPSSLPYTSNNIHFVPIPYTGGKRLIDKLDIVWHAPATIFKVFKYLNKVDLFQLRAPTGIGVYLIPLLTLFSTKNGWFKYAGNWNQENPPFGYAIQRWFLKRQKRKVTINGKWLNQPKQCLTFENPCLTPEFREQGMQVLRDKQFKKPYIYCFAGRLEDEKGVRRIIEAISLIEDKTAIKEVHLIGNGPKMEEYKALAKNVGVPFIFHGFLKFEAVFEVFKKAHFFLLPSSASEGFPKVIAEALNFGCIPIVSKVSSIAQYIHSDINGFISAPNTSENLKTLIEHVHTLDGITLKSMQSEQRLIGLFTYTYYLERIKKEVVTK
ncbi:glycosyltransferase [Cognatitamlana onchidii]|uniref:glycosyltransferase n=1 Tax=Cognatitamlana onchidii TaxID=2562860 RepID=UPI0010A65C0A|nr:glycosyltransferase [Algibacter onchidii]